MHEIDNILNETAYEQYLIKCAIEDVKLNGFAELLLAEGSGVGPYKLRAIREDVGDKIKGLYDKLINTITRLYSKFIDFISRKINNDAAYLQKNKDILFNTKAPDVPIENMGDHEAGIQRYSNTKIPPFQSVVDEIKDDGTALRQKLITIYKDPKQNFKEVATNFFSGNDNRRTVNLNQLNVTNMYNFCVDFQTKIKPLLDQDRKTLEATKSTINQVITVAKQAAQNNQAAQPAAKPEVKPANSASGNGSTSESTSLLFDYFPEASSILSESEYILEADPPGPQATIGKPATSTAGATKQQAADTKDTNAEVSKQTDSNDPGRAGNSGSTLQQPADGQTPNQQAGVNSGDKVNEVEAKEKAFAAYCSVAGDIIACKMQGLAIIQKDYMNFLKYIIAANVGNAKAPENTAPVQPATNYNQNNQQVQQGQTAAQSA